MAKTETPAPKPTLNMYDKDMLFWQYENKHYALLVQQDELVDDPRLDNDYVARLCCQHPRYNLGDYQGEEKISVEAFLANLIREAVPMNVVAEKLKKRIVPGYAHDDYVSGAPETDQEIVDTFLEFMEDGEVENFAAAAAAVLEDYAVILPLWLYDHSGITMSVGSGGGGNPFADRWDSGCVGFAAVTKQLALENLAERVLDADGQPIKETSPDGRTWHYKSRPAGENNWKALAIHCIQDEVEDYDRYLRGDVYWFQLYERADNPDSESEDDDWDQSESCGGFYGSDIMENGILDSIGAGLSEAIESKSYTTGTCKNYTVVHHRFCQDKPYRK